VADRADEAAFARAIGQAGVRWDLVVDCIGFNADHGRQDLACFAGRAAHLVFISTDSTLDPRDRPWRIDESFDRYEPEVPYGVGKRAAELALLDGAAAAAERGTAVTIFRPCHIYGPGSLLGCIPEHGRDPKLIERIRAGEPLRLVGGGHFLQQPIFAADLARMALSVAGNPRTAGETYMTAGPDVVASREFYWLIADVLGVPRPPIVEVPIEAFLAATPERRAFCCHRVYSMEKARSHGLAVPSTPLAEGLAMHVRSIVES
jgi:nucleoside-diphosphate-sugar epimerase